MIASVLLAVALILLPAMNLRAETREFFIITGEWKWEGKPGEKVADRGRDPVSVIERYTFDPGFIVVRKGDRVVLNIHALKGSDHDVNIPEFGVIDLRIKRGQEKSVSFVADKAGLFRLVCKKHDKPETEGPMVGYIYVLE